MSDRKIKLYSGPLSMFGAKSVIALHEKQLDFELILVPFDEDDRYRPKHPEVLRINPKAQVPVLIAGELEIFDSTQISEYMEDLCPKPNLWPEDINSRARARLMEHQSDEVFFPHIIGLMGLQDNLASDQARQHIEAAQDFYQQLEAQLADNSFLAETYSYADIAFFMAQLFGERMNAQMTDQTPRLLEWRARMAQRPAVQAGIGPLLNHLRNAGRPIPRYLDKQRTA